MPIRWYNTLVVLFWLATMAWLTAAKVLPPLLIGEPPNYRTILRDEAGVKQEGPVAWQILWEDRAIGWATSETRRPSEGRVDLESRIRLDNLRPREMSLGWLAPFFDPLAEADGSLDLDVTSRVRLSEEGALRNFQSTVKLGPLDIRLRGEVRDNKLEVNFRAEELNYSTSTDWVSNVMVGDGVSPRVRLPNLRVGQKWTEPVYSPFNQPNSPMQILAARVERTDHIPWNGEMVEARLIVYRKDAGAEMMQSQPPRARVWVHPDGAVLKQEVLLLGFRLVFARLPSAEPLPAPHD
jgi:hypothetical protein